MSYKVINEGTTVFVDMIFYDSNNNSVTPISIKYKLINQTTDTVLVNWTNSLDMNTILLEDTLITVPDNMMSCVYELVIEATLPDNSKKTETIQFIVKSIPT